MSYSQKTKNLVESVAELENSLNKMDIYNNSNNSNNNN